MSENTRKYVKLGIHASSFYAPGSRFKVMRGDVLPLPINYQRDGVIMSAISGGHLVMASEAEAKESTKNVKAVRNTESSVNVDNKELINRISELESQLEEANRNLADAIAGIEHLTKVSDQRAAAIELLEAGKMNIFKFDEAGLDSYIKENYDLSKNDVKAYDKMSLEDKQAYAYDLEKNSEDVEEEG